MSQKKLFNYDAESRILIAFRIYEKTCLQQQTGCHSPSIEIPVSSNFLRKDLAVIPEFALCSFCGK